MGSKASSQQNQSQTTAPDPYARFVLDSALGKASAVADRPYQAYSGPLTAGFNAQEQAATDSVNGLAGAAGKYYSSASAAGDAGAAAVNPTGLGAAQISQFSNPFQQQVIDATLATVDQQNKIAQNQQTSNAIGAGAFGGDRSGLAAAALEGQQALARNSTVANLNQANFAQALGAAQQQQGVNLSAAEANRAAIQSNAGLQAQIGSAVSSTGLAAANAQLQTGALQQQTEQAADTAKYGQFQQEQAFPYQQAAFLANIAEGIAPNLGGTTTGQSTTQTSPLNSLVGGLASGIGFFSDERLKEDIRPIGKTFDGQKLYSFRYKGEPATRIGLIAQEVEDRHPHAVGSLGDAKVVDYREATRKAADKGHFALGGAALKRFASGGSTGFGPIPYATSAAPYPGGDSYIPAPTGTGGRGLSLPSLKFDSPAQAQPNVGQAMQAGKSFANTGLGDTISDFTQDNFGFASGGKVIGLAAARQRRGYDGGGVVGDEGLVFDPDAVGADTSFMPGLGVGATADRMVPAAPQLPPPQLPRGADLVPVPLTPGQVDGSRPMPAAPPPTIDAPLPPPRPQGLAGADASGVSAPVGLGGASAAQAAGGIASDNSLGQNPDGSLARIPVYPARGPGSLAVPGPGLGAAAAYAPTTPEPTSGLGAINSAAPVSQQPLGGGDAPGYGFERTLGRTLGFEGGYNPSDANGTPSNFGINGAAHPGLDIKNLTRDDAKGIYKREYWDGIGADKLPPALAHVAFDTAVMVGPERAKQMIADSGGDPKKFMDLRDAYTNDLLARNPEKYGSYAASWSSRSAALRGDIGAGGAPASALGYAGSDGGGGGSTSGGRGLTAARVVLPPSGDMADATSMLPTAPTALGRASDLFGARIGGTGVSSPGHSGGLLGLLPGMSDQERAGLISFGGALAGSTSKSFGTALGQGIQGGVKGFNEAQDIARKSGLARASIANTGSEIQNRGAVQGIEHDRVRVAQDELANNLKRVTQEGRNFESEDRFRQAQEKALGVETSVKRYETMPDPNGNGVAVFDRADPYKGVTLPGDPVQRAVDVASSPSAAATGATSAGAPPALGGTPSGTAPTTAPAASFLSTGQPVLAAPRGFLPANHYAHQLDLKRNPAALAGEEAQTREEMTRSTESAQKSSSALYYADQMDRDMATLDKNGLLKPGAAFPERLNLAKSYNLAAESLGLPKVDDQAAAAGQSLLKDQNRLASQLTSSLGSREAASVFSSMMSATPGPSNTAAGYRQISASIRVLAQRDVDRNAFVQNWAGRYGSTREAEVQFNKLNPPMVYARHAQMLAKVDQPSVDLLQAHANDPRAVRGFERTYGAGSARYFTGGAQ